MILCWDKEWTLWKQMYSFLIILRDTTQKQPSLKECVIIVWGSLTPSLSTCLWACCWQNDWEKKWVDLSRQICQSYSQPQPSQCVSHHITPTYPHRFGGNKRGASHQEQWSSCSSASIGSGWPVALCVCAPFFSFLSYEWDSSHGFMINLRSLDHHGIKNQTTQPSSSRANLLKSLCQWQNSSSVTKHVFFVHRVNES